MDELINTSERQALCLKCLACCKRLQFPADRFGLSEDDMMFYKTRGCTFNMQKGIFFIAMHNICPQLTARGCKIYDSRPLACQIYDGRNDPLVKDVCLWDEKNRERLKKGLKK